MGLENRTREVRGSELDAEFEGLADIRDGRAQTERGADRDEERAGQGRAGQGWTGLDNWRETGDRTGQGRTGQGRRGALGPTCQRRCEREGVAAELDQTGEEEVRDEEGAGTRRKAGGGGGGGAGGRGDDDEDDQTWEEIYQGWERDDLKFYWRRMKLEVVK
eukprot:752842-Hanusia_phi.AAC.1